MRLALLASLATMMLLAVLPFTFADSGSPATPNGVLAVGASNGPQQRTFTVVVGSTGFNGSSAPLALSVGQGDNITIKFVYGDGKLLYDNQHVIKIEGYNLRSGALGKKAPVRYVNFVAGQAGTFRFHCIVPCVGMENLQQGTIDVSPTTQKGTTTTVLGPISYQVARGPMLLTTRLTDANGNPVVGVLVDFFLNTDFGQMNIGQNVTDSSGSVRFSYGSSLPAQVEVTARYGGDSNHLNSNSSTRFAAPVSTVGTNQTTPYLFGQTRYIDLRLIGIPPLPAYATVLVALTVLAAVWSIYIFVLTHILAIRRLAKKVEGNK